jgi:hypothetical protein
MTQATLLARKGQDAEALQGFDRALSIGWASPLMVIARLESGRAAERPVQRLIDAWRHADPEPQPYGQEAKTALARLSS